MSKITRQKRKDNFTVVNNDILQNSKLSWAAKGMLVYLLHLPDGWQINVADLSNRSKNGRDGTSAIIKELMEVGYISRLKIKNEKGQFKGYDYTVTDEPENGKAVNGLSENGSPENGKAVTNKDYSYEELNEVNTNEVKRVVELHSTVLLDEVDETSVEIHHVPEYFDTEQKTKRKNVAAQKEKVDDPTPIRAMFELYAEKYAELNNGVKPEFMVKYTPAMKNLYGILRARSITAGFVPLDNLEPWRDFLTAWTDYLAKNEKEKWHRDNFNPLTFFSQFNSIISKLNNRPKTDAEKWVEWGKRQGL